VDNDCDAVIDEEVTTTWYQDDDGDGWGQDDQTTQACELPEGYAAEAGDCDDADTLYHPYASETDCTDPNDYNCDGSTGYTDYDGDGWAACAECDDADAAINPDELEICNDIDDDCDTLTDDADPDVDTSTGEVFYADADVDGYGDNSDRLMACEQPADYVALGTDCDDGDSHISPAAGEVCDSIDNDCDTLIDDDDPSVDVGTGSIYFEDADGDGYGTASSALATCDLPGGYSTDSTDCDDASIGVNPGATEICDGIDNNCDGLTDDATATGAVTWYRDVDGDGYGDSSTSVAQCAKPVGYVLTGGDCNDAAIGVNPGATEVCDAVNVDEDCDGRADDADSSVSTATTTPWYRDGDSDGYGLLSMAVAACDQPTGYVTSSSDCNDGAVAINPGAQEICDAANTDEDCDGTSDDADSTTLSSGKSTGYQDADSDGYGGPTSGSYCDMPSGYLSTSTDCNDGVAAINPGAQEVCDAANTDEDCDGKSDNDDSSSLASTKASWYLDSDGDTYGSTTTAQYCDLPTGYSTVASDCDDSKAAVNPAAQEVCDAANTDEDCDGVADNNDPTSLATTMSLYYVDSDRDTYGTTAAVAFCDQPTAYATNTTDCDDTRASVNPAGTEVCDSLNLDEDCDGLTDDLDSSVTASTKTTWYQDADGDTYGTTVTATTCDQPTGFAALPLDCDDTKAAINPAAQEICDAANTDEDCDGLTDDLDGSAAAGGMSSWYADGDSDGYGVGAASQACDRPVGYAALDEDCDDGAAAVNPGATELCDALNTDEDCDGVSDNLDSSASSATKTSFYLDYDGDTYGGSTSGAYCDLPSGYSALDTDCDDTKAAINPGATEICDSSDADEDCDGLSDDLDSSTKSSTKYTFYIDGDGDAYGSSTSVKACNLVSGYSLASTDCDDANPAISPAATEVCDAADTDEDCDGLSDNDDSTASAATKTTYFLDSDGDTYGGTSTQALCDQDTGYVTSATDCDDSNSSVYPGALETWYDGRDSNCDGLSDYDQDYDGANATAYGGTDCDDTVDTVYSGATEVRDGYDNDCDNTCDEGVITAGELIISEIMPNPAGVVDPNGEWFEVYNTSSTDIRMCGWVIADNGYLTGIYSQITDQLLVPAYGYAVMGRSGSSTIMGGVSVDWAYGSSLALSNSADDLYITVGFSIIDQVSYTSGWPFASGYSMELKSSAMTSSGNDSSANWCKTTGSISLQDHGTPGTTNSGC
jgi:hypothetical protein